MGSVRLDRPYLFGRATLGLLHGTRLSNRHTGSTSELVETLRGFGSVSPSVIPRASLLHRFLKWFVSWASVG